MIPRVSVVISNYNGVTLKLVEESLESILANSYENLEVLLIDNASTDNSVEVIRKRFGGSPRLKIIQNPVNMYSQGLNLGIANATGEYVAFFNNDAIVENGYFEKFVKFFEKNKKIALAQGKLVSYFDHKKIDSVGETMDSFGNPITIGSGEEDRGQYEKQCEVLSVSGSCSILRKSVIKDVGYFDDSYGIGYEDLDLSVRARMRGYSIVYCPFVRAFHRRGATDLSPMVKIKVRWHFNKNRVQTMLKDFPLHFIVLNLPVALLIFILAGLWEIVVHNYFDLGITRFTSIIWVILNLPNILYKRWKIRRSRKSPADKKNISLLSQRSFLQTFNLFTRSGFSKK